MSCIKFTACTSESAVLSVSICQTRRYTRSLYILYSLRFYLITFFCLSLIIIIYLVYIDTFCYKCLNAYIFFIRLMEKVFIAKLYLNIKLQTPFQKKKFSLYSALCLQSIFRILAGIWTIRKISTTLYLVRPSRTKYSVKTRNWRNCECFNDEKK